MPRCVDGRDVPQQDLLLRRRDGKELNGWEGLLPLSGLEAQGAVQEQTASLTPPRPCLLK